MKKRKVYFTNKKEQKALSDILQKVKEKAEKEAKAEEESNENQNYK